MFAQEEYVQVTDDDKSYRVGDSGIYETFTDDIKRLFQSYQREYGRCQSKVYVDTDNGPRAIGWVFVKRAKYTDSDDTYLQETWVSLHDKSPKKSVEYLYHPIG